MKYMLLIYDDPKVWANFSETESKAIMGEYFAYSDELVKSGAFVAGDPLAGVEAATTVRVRDGQTLTTDGPFAETKEFLSGYYIVEAPDLDAAIAWGAKIPSSRVGSIEVRPIVDMTPDAMSPS